jgi:DNA polymerase-3 subunit delta
MGHSKAKSDNKNALIYVLKGQDDSLVGARLQMLLDELIEPAQRVTALLDINGPGASLPDVLDELRTLPFLADKRVVVVRNADDFISDNRELLEKYFDAPCPTGILILIVSDWRSNTKLARKLPEVGRLITVTQPKAPELVQRLVEYAREAHDKRLSSQTARILIDLTGDELPRLYSEIDKLTLYVEREKTITPAHIESLIGYNRIFGAFEVIDAISAGSAAQAVDRLRRMFAEDSSAEYTVVGAFAYHLRRMFNAKLQLEKGDHPDKIAGRLQIWSNKERFFAQLREMSLRQIGDYLRRLGQTDYEIKTGRTKTPVAMEQFVLELVAC